MNADVTTQLLPSSTVMVRNLGRLLGATQLGPHAGINVALGACNFLRSAPSRRGLRRMLLKGSPVLSRMGQ